MPNPFTSHDKTRPQVVVSTKNMALYGGIKDVDLSAQALVLDTKGGIVRIAFEKVTAVRPVKAA